MRISETIALRMLVQFFTKNLILVIAGVFVITNLSHGQNAPMVSINPSQEYQLIRGFGGINHPVWYSDLNASERELAFGNGPGQMGLTVLRIWIADDRNQWPLGLETAQKAVEEGLIIFASPWNPPDSMTYRDSEGQQRMDPAHFQDYVDHLNAFIDYMSTNGVDLYAVSTQNEPDYAHDWTEWTPQESADFIRDYGDQIQTRLTTPESFQYRKDVYDPILNDPEVLANVDIFGTHLYGTQLRDFPYPLFEEKGAGKELWMTEVYTDSQNDANLWDLAMDAAVHIQNAMVLGNFQTYVWWPLRRYYALIHDGVGDKGNPVVAAPGTITKRGYIMAQFSKFIRPGFIRIEATSEPVSGVYVSAYKKENERVIVVVNDNSYTQNVDFSLNASPSILRWRRIQTTSEDNILELPAVEASNYLQIDAPANSITTLVAELGPAEPQGPYGGEAASIPGVIEFEHYDVGGNGFAYYDDSPGSETEVDFRTNEDVDIEKCTDEGGGYNLGYATAGEWLEYTIDVGQSGNYDLTIRAASDGDGKTIDLDLDGSELASDIAIPNTEGWQSWTSVEVESLYLEEGEHILRMTIGSAGYVNLNSMTFSLADAVSVSLEKEMEQSFSVSLQNRTLHVHGLSSENKVQLMNLQGRQLVQWGATGGQIPSNLKGVFVLGVISPSNDLLESKTILIP